MKEKLKVQICFAGNADLTKVKEQLETIKKDQSIEFYCCFLPKHIVIEKGFSTDIVDLLESELGDRLVWQLQDCKTFSEAMNILPEKRIETANLVNRMYVLDSGTAKGVAEEIKLFTQCKVILM